MIRLSLSRTAEVVGGRLQGPDLEYTGCSIDSRTLEPGNLFVALRGEHHDGHRFVEAARRAGAVAVMVEQEQEGDLPQVLVADTRRALGRLAAAWRDGFDLPVVAVTGSNGKTTVKEMIASICARVGEVLATRGNYNNEIGLPLTLFGLAPGHRFAVLEMGANHPGEIERLCRIASPRVGVITQCAPAHLAGFGDVATVARSKGEIVAGLPADGVAVINADDEWAGLWETLAGDRRVLRFGLGPAAGITAREVSCGPGGSRFRLVTRDGEIGVALPLPGRHNVMNALAAAAAALALGLPLEAIREGLEGVTPVRGRLQFRPAAGRGITLIDDSYNANPGSLEAAISVLAGQPGRSVLVLGEMGELGAEAPRWHRRAGELARAAGIAVLYGCGPLAAEAVTAFGAGGHACADRAELIDRLQRELREGDVVLVKGSRSQHMEQVVEALAARGGQAA
ncbi:MAG: UDP-N-acetylmuramoyl-tripeptide--D-alanyl-D-alanine ligase [Gammaproteobacteria bacterium]|nr:MAG: UDP-N-acetylmuramoyl-tripeptide--D-alanyl-D-alanine ligase [Gammaproteobacteria bacterium]